MEDEFKTNEDLQAGNDPDIKAKKKRTRNRVLLFISGSAFIIFVCFWFYIIYVEKQQPKLRKPVIYLYTEETTDVSVQLDFKGKLTTTYPAYNGGWNVTAEPDGTLTDSEGKQYSYLYWEGVSDIKFDMSEGFCVKGSDTAEFLEEALEKLGLTRREANEFIVYWLPYMEGNAYNVISFQKEAYTDSAVLHISPEPDTVIRVFMAYYPSKKAVEIPKQELTAPERVGFTVVEWGGSEIKK